MDNRGLAGAFMFVGGLQFAIGMVLADILYPAYNVSRNYISDLVATCRETCTIAGILHFLGDRVWGYLMSNNQ